MAKIQATVKLNRSGPLTHTGRGGRTIKKGQKVTLTDPEEIRYYQTIAGFDVRVTQGKMAARAPVEPDPVEDDDDDDDEESDDDEDDEESDDDEVSEAYLKADLKKMTAKELVALIVDDDELQLTKADVKGLKKSKIVTAILEAQEGDDE